MVRTQVLVHYLVKVLGHLLSQFGLGEMLLDRGNSAL